MLILILGIALVAFVIVVKLSIKTGPHIEFHVGAHELYVVLSWTLVFLILGLVIAICCLAPEVATESVLDKKIAMYQEENIAIEQDIDRIVDAYLEHEHDTFADLKTEESSITLVTLFPELKSDTRYCSV